MRMMWSLLVVVAYLWITGCTKAPPQGPQLQLSEATRRAIGTEIARARDNETVVVIEEPKSKKFVQFGYKNLWVDLPLQTLSADELSRAERVMGRFGIPKQTRLGPTTAGGTMVMTSFQKFLGEDLELAVRVADAVFREVYLLPPEVQLQFERIEH